MQTTHHRLLVALGENAHGISKPLNVQPAPQQAAVQQQDETTTTTTDCGGGDDNSCLFQLFYDKMITFFSEVVFSLEASSNDTHHKANEVAPQPQLILSHISTRVNTYSYFTIVKNNKSFKHKSF